MRGAQDTTADVVAIGLGPFNLGLACLADPLPDVDLIGLDSRKGFSWHPGLMLDDATVQVPFLADLVTMADPTSPYSFLRYLKDAGRLYPFYVRESFYPLRSEYDAYCRWAADRVTGLRWEHHVTAVEHDARRDELVVHSLAPDGPTSHRARHVVLGIGTEAHVPEPLQPLGDRVVHTGDYLTRRQRIHEARHVLVVGSGQSSAEVVRDLLPLVGHGLRLTWVTRSPRFFPMEYTKLTLELTSPEHTDYFHALPESSRDRLSRRDRSLHRGISADLIDDIHEQLYRLTRSGPAPVDLVTDVAVTASERQPDGARVHLQHQEKDEHAWVDADVVVAGTGYRPRDPEVLQPLGDMIARDGQGRLAAGRHWDVDHGRGRVFVQNAEEHTHGVVAPDLGMGAHRSSVILNRISGRPAYPVEERFFQQHFGLGHLLQPEGPGVHDSRATAHSPR